MGGDALVLPLRGTRAATEAAGCGLRADVAPVTRRWRGGGFQGRRRQLDGLFGRRRQLGRYVAGMRQYNVSIDRSGEHAEVRLRRWAAAGCDL